VSAAADRLLAGRMLLRSLLVQSSWNFRGMQNLGYFFVSWPALSRRGLDRAETTRLALRNLRLFNTHPYFAGLVAATVAREEQGGAAEDATDNLRRSLMCVLGSVGDEFFWATLRPLAALAALPAALAGRAWAPLALLAVYNVPHFGVRAWGVFAGLAHGRGIAAALNRRVLSRAVPVLTAAGAVLGGCTVGLAAASPAWSLLPGRALAAVCAAGLVLAALVVAQVRGVSQTRLLGLLATAAVVAGAVRVGFAP
jgi:PTS system mannose-specific IID component